MTFPIPNSVRPYLDQFSGRSWLLPIIQEWFEQGSEQFLLLTGAALCKNADHKQLLDRKRMMLA